MNPRKTKTERETKTEKERLAKRLLSLNRHRMALDTAINDFGPDLDLDKWKQVFESDNPKEINRCMAVTGGYSTLINGYVEMLRTSVWLMGLTPHRRLHAKELFDLVLTDGCLTEDQKTLVTKLYLLEGSIEHVSPDVTAAEVLLAVLELRECLPQLIETTIEWLKRHHIELIPNSEN